jgi:hypothetical protein
VFSLIKCRHVLEAEPDLIEPLKRKLMELATDMLGYHRPAVRYLLDPRNLMTDAEGETFQGTETDALETSTLQHLAKAGVAAPDEVPVAIELPVELEASM